ncbi:MAG: hypothetical protein IT337_06500 [Thermomicrobiales bacterium]|nr:hypothetical protein [Thermomicrobiales bacterium]
MSAMTSSSTINLTDGTRYKVRTRDELAIVAGPIRMVQCFPPDGDGGWYERDGPTVAWFVLTPYGWLHKPTGLIDSDSVQLALRVFGVTDER